LQKADLATAFHPWVEEAEAAEEVDDDCEEVVDFVLRGCKYIWEEQGAQIPSECFPSFGKLVELGVELQWWEKVVFVCRLLELDSQIRDNRKRISVIRK
jgi:hypothetical protein